jgi:ribosomal protein L11 methyltransferase
MNYIQLSIEANEEEQEILISNLSDLNALGFEQTDKILLSYFDEDVFQSYDVKKILEGYVFHLTPIPERNWNEEWESNFSPVIVNGFCAIRAYFHEPIKNVEHEIIITPKMSFGTGHHATTYMMIEQMQNINFINKKVFDFGTGTGILAILAEKLGAFSITAIDNDEWSIKNAKENFEKNNVYLINLYQSSVIPEGSFDVILANINKNILLEYRSSLVNTLSDGGILLMSGLLKEDVNTIVEVFHVLKLKYYKQNGIWVSLFFMK